MRIPAGPMNAATILAAIVLIICLVLAAYAIAAGRNEAFFGGSDSADFPYWSRSLRPAAEMFESIRRAKFKTAKTRRGPVLTRTYPGDYREADSISNHYTEDPRLDCRAGKSLTPREAWSDLKRKKGTPEALREAVYAKSRECNIFNPTFARWVIERTAGRGARVLDPSSGWGDRLIGALAAGAKQYDGYDPNPRLQDGYRAIVDELGNGDHESFHVTEAPFEEAAIVPELYDIALTSPPYYAYEEYVPPGGEGEGAQSIGRYPDYETWAARMYRPYLANAYHGVRKGGWVVLYIEDIALEGKVYPLRELTDTIMRDLGAKRAGSFGLKVVTHKGKGKIRWALAWRKPS